MRLKEIVDQINQTLRLTLNQEKFQRGVFHGLAKLVVKKESNDDNTYSAMIYDNTGKEIICEVDDTYPFKIYHRCLNVSQTTEKANQFGDGNNALTETANMVAIVYGKKSVIGLCQEDLGSIISASFPSDLSITDISKTTIKNGQINNDSFSVHNTEYKSNNYPLNPEDYYFSYTYQIVTTFDKSCVDECLTPSNSQVIVLNRPCTCISSEGILLLPEFSTTAGQNAYTIPTLSGKTIGLVFFDNMFLRSDQYSLSGQIFTLTDNSFPITAGQKVVIGYLN